ncbi:hypothetical protein NKI46_21260 [Mesorhizobium sp. M0615]|uniref:hypothetical protein n=1 Tax=unclassified Mesorhizobium TaxID=325217 RepID=UPI00333A481A
MLLERTLGSAIKIERNLDAALGPVLVDPNQLDVAMLNLAVNAKDAMAGVGTLTIETSDVPDDIDDGHSLAGSCVRMTVRDAGCA